MRAIFFLALLSIIALGAPAGAQQVTVTQVPPGEAAEALPRLMLEQPIYEAGEIEAGITIAHKFAIKNEGRAPLVISEVRAGCGCIVSYFDKEIAPGETGGVTLNMTVYKEWAGHSLRRTAWVVTNDPISPQVRLTMRARIRPAEEQPPAKP